MRSVIRPEPATFRTLFLRALKKGHSISMHCTCRVEYKGRAVSTLETGDRLVIIKPDKTVIIHQPAGRNPVNWMPVHSHITLDENIIRVESVNPREFMTIHLEKVLVFLSSPLTDGASLVQAGSEADMANMIYQNPHVLGEFVPASREEQTAYGFIDVFGRDYNNNLVIVECKRYKAGLDAVQQLRRYVEKIKKDKGKEVVNGIIAAPAITENAKKMLEDWGFNFIKVEPPMYLLPDREKQKNLGEFFS
ncbi:endonuclease NucS [archaeon CG10_big_fil_rev_8_21_14_0_10_43_11]|nr:MAG: endonuclease NucS [archaeon CG10_big_fil_rev_8_21_14_0_10_43_11]